MRPDAQPALIDPTIPLIASEQLFGPGTEVDIAHRGAIYRLRITRQGKLVLNK